MYAAKSSLMNVGCPSTASIISTAVKKPGVFIAEFNPASSAGEPGITSLIRSPVW